MQGDIKKYLADKIKYNWVETKPDYYAVDVTENFDEPRARGGWYKSWQLDNSIYGSFHRTDGPARMWQSGFKEYWLNGIFYREISSDEEWLIKQILE